MNIAASFALGSPTFAVVLGKRTVGRLAASLTARIAAVKSRLLAGGLLRSIEWGKKSGPRDQRGRQSITYEPIDAFIEQRPALDRGTLSTERSGNTVLHILDPRAITDAHFFRYGEPPHVYKIKAVDGIVQDVETGTRFSSEVVLIR